MIGFAIISQQTCIDSNQYEKRIKKYITSSFDKKTAYFNLNVFIPNKGHISNVAMKSQLRILQLKENNIEIRTSAIIPFIISLIIGVIVCLIGAWVSNNSIVLLGIPLVGIVPYFILYKSIKKHQLRLLTQIIKK